MKQKLGLVFGGRSGEHEVSLQSAKSIASAVNKDLFELFLIAIDKKGDWYLANPEHYLADAEDPSKISLDLSSSTQIALIPYHGSNQLIEIASGKPLGSLDVIFPINHGTFGEDGSIQGFCRMLNLPCVGADVLGSSVGMDKIVSKYLLQQQNIAVARCLVANHSSNLETLASQAISSLGLPLFVKPACSGSSVGVYKANSIDELISSIKKALKFDFQVLIEETVTGREIECAILGNDELIASPAGEIVPENGFYSYEAKYISAEGAKLILPADLPQGKLTELQSLAKRVYKELNCKGLARVDFFLTDQGQFILNEINTLPGFTKISMYPKLMELAGINYSELITRLVSLAIEKHQKQEQYLLNVLQQPY